MKNNWRIFLVAGVVTLLSACGPDNKPDSKSSKATTEPAAATQTTVKAKPKKPRECKFTMGFDVWEPYQYIGFGREIQGMDVELIEMIAEKLNCDVEYHQDSWGNLLGMLKVGKIDFVLGASVTEERKSFALFSEPYRAEVFQLYVRADEEHKHRQASVADFVRDNLKVGTIGEYFYGDDLTELMDSEKYSRFFVPAFMGEINVARLIDGDIDGFLEDAFVGASLIRRKGLSRYVAPHQAKINTGDVYVMFSKATIKPERVDQFNDALRAIKNEGKYDKLIQKYSN